MKQETSEKPEQTTQVAPTRKEMASRWAALVGMVAVGVIYAALPSTLVIGPSWILLAIEAVFIIPIAIYLISGRELSHTTIRAVLLLLLAIITLALVIGVLLLIFNLPTDKNAVNLLRTAALLWGFNVLVFGLWYWEIDGGGPYKRHQSGHQATDFMFPQQVDSNKSGWVPHFLDYLFLAFTGATALSPADTYPLTRTAKALMMIEAVLSMTIIVLLAARAVNILGS
ncbi:MAG TPA: hypothetical protein VGT44_01970 [Ktedonobacteraceae bacterium]|nr:hypothetical protein [Ktedonobacteraceae bacterium]